MGGAARGPGARGHGTALCTAASHKVMKRGRTRQRTLKCWSGPAPTRCRPPLFPRSARPGRSQLDGIDLTGHSLPPTWGTQPGGFPRLESLSIVGTNLTGSWAPLLPPGLHNRRVKLAGLAGYRTAQPACCRACLLLNPLSSFTAGPCPWPLPLALRPAAPARRAACRVGPRRRLPAAENCGPVLQSSGRRAACRVERRGPLEEPD